MIFLVFLFPNFIEGPDGQPCTMVIRSLHWTVPSYWIWGLPFFLFYSTRSSQFLHERPNQNLFRILFLSLLSPMVNLYSFAPIFFFFFNLHLRLLNYHSFWENSKISKLLISSHKLLIWCNVPHLSIFRR